MKSFEQIVSSRSHWAVVFVRFIVGAVFLSEGTQKFLFPAELGVGRFIKIGIPWPEFMAPFVGIFETICGVLLILGLLTRLASIPMIINMLVAISTTKIPLLLGRGFWNFAHEARVDFSMLCGCIFLLIVGAGTFSIDSRLESMLRSGKKDPS